VGLRSDLRTYAGRFRGAELVVYVTVTLSFADTGGPYLRQVSTWAEACACPVIVAAQTTQISTRELRTVGVEAAYQAETEADVARMVSTWMPAGSSRLRIARAGAPA
jgi:hypothetical protein